MPELHSCVKACGYHRVGMSELANLLEKSGMGSLQSFDPGTFSSLMVKVETAHGERPPELSAILTAARQERFKEAFDTFDKDGSGTLEMHELPEALLFLGVKGADIMQIADALEACGFEGEPHLDEKGTQ